MQEWTLAVKNSQPLNGCLALCSTETWIAVLHTVVVQWIWYFQPTINCGNDPKGLCRYTSTSQLLFCPCIRVWKGHSGFHFQFKTFWNQKFPAEKAHSRSSLLTYIKWRPWWFLRGLLSDGKTESSMWHFFEEKEALCPKKYFFPLICNVVRQRWLLPSATEGTAFI